ncbi:DUF262 domain-containing protein [Staphylococcus pseudintermedius]|uniref:DUF262 domain-containing protein n=1 Tax=Staphylococcus pseudintermedius TaxID=283734 RepID=UPI001656410D|nr:DUF262 domain-containing protein [Staphylococcus pseudintermedius]EGQ3225887.1 DUF262 domain-containing protein [Staphylococcus pseudintermedius]EGQ4022168.1 DUF262 domain-containing protein [Staphylococcus pseudintermedius]EGQ4161571.1 DUF262 domain-containing protein [Staphylococcus pseudintermedius]EHC9922993.1 DUF262 domain-containing protein [Staphylococcus pseudintermedius]EHD0810737.1 DUF262 domain-containing protein [Staphylococcus pseudintermedius]
MKLFYITKDNTNSESEIVRVSDLNDEDLKYYMEIDDFSEFQKRCDELDLVIDETTENHVMELLDSKFEEINGKLEEFEIKHWVSNRSFGELIEMYEEDEITIPIMQRNFVWDSVQCSRLIESIILGLPIPPLFLIEVDSNKYEVIDGLQRITAISNFVKKRPWNYSKDRESTSKGKAKLSKLVDKSIAGKSFDQLNENFQRKIKRSTIPLIEFKQLTPDNYNSKYLIFERINTGSQKLNSMQIRKSLASGEFMIDLYKKCEENDLLNSIFTKTALKKDLHVEAYLRTYVFNKLVNDEFQTRNHGIKNILNDYCENHRKTKVESEFDDKFKKALELLFNNIDIFIDKPFRRVNKNKDNGMYEYVGNLSVTIMESLLAAIINNIENDINFDKLKYFYEQELSKYFSKKSLLGENPFSTSTGKLDSIRDRFRILNELVVKSIEY